MNRVNVDVLVTDKQGRAVPGLSADSFQLSVDKQKVVISNFASLADGTLAPRIVLLVDNRHLRLALRNFALREVGAALVNWQRDTGAEVMVLSNDDRLRLRLPFTNDPRKLTAALYEVGRDPVYSDELYQQLQGAGEVLGRHLRTLRNSTGREAGATMDALSSSLQPYAETFYQDTRRMIDTLGQLASALGGFEGSKALVIVNDGLALQPFGLLGSRFAGAGGGNIRIPNDPSSVSGQQMSRRNAGANVQGAQSAGPQWSSRFSRYNLRAETDALIATANASQVAFYPLRITVDTLPEEHRPDAIKDGSSRRGLSDLGEGILRLAASTGGRALAYDEELGPFLEGLKDTSRGRYSLAFEPPRVDGEFHAIEVKTKSGQVSHREGFISRTLEQRLTERTLAALTLDLVDNPHQLAYEIQKQTAGPDDTWTLTIIAKLPIEQMTLVEDNGEHLSDGRLIALFVDEAGQVSPVQQMRIPLRIPASDLEEARQQDFGARIQFTMPKGEQRIAMGFWDALAGSGSFIAGTVTAGEAQTGGGTGH